MWFSVLSLLVVTPAAASRINFSRSSSKQVIVFDSRDPHNHRPLCADSYSAAIGTKICTQLGFSGASHAEYASFTDGPTVSLLCGLRTCLGYNDHRCHRSVLLYCSQRESYCAADEIAMGRRCIVLQRDEDPLRGYSASALFCEKKGLSLFAAEDQHEMDDITNILRLREDNREYMTSAVRKGKQWVWVNGNSIPGHLIEEGDGSCLKVSRRGWSAVNCGERMRALCQTGEECVPETGRYYGRVNVTKGGLDCIKWNLVARDVNEAKSSLGSWNHNYCRNPNGLKDHPWCLVSPNTFQFCDIPACSQDSVAFSERTEEADECKEQEFRCGSSNECVAEEFVCDYEVDCANGADEENCPNWLSYFIITGDFKVIGSVIEVWTHIPHAQGCARRCLDSSVQECFSFSFEENTRTCILSADTSSSSLQPSPHATSYRKPILTERYATRLTDGIVELLKHGHWAAVCPQNSSASRERHLCESFGYQNTANSTNDMKLSPHWSIACLRSEGCTAPDLNSCLRPLSCSLCSASEYQCSSGECINQLEVCNSVADCRDGDDEQICNDLSWRLIDQDKLRGGLLQVKRRGLWYPVCADTFHASYAETICKLLRNSTRADSADRNKSRGLLPWNIICSAEKCDVENQVTCLSGFARIRCPAVSQGLKSCGRRYVDMAARDPRKQRYARVVGGFEALPGAFPWTAAVRLRRGHVHHCGASIIAPEFLLTAAHCFDEEPNVERYEVVVGDWDNAVVEGSEQSHNITRVVKHPNYQDLFADDLALIELTRPVIYGKFVQPICLPPEDFIYEAGKKCVVSGWGSLGDQYPKRLQAASLPILQRSKCIESSTIYESMSVSAFCAGYLSGGVDSCQGDSGGPFACQIGDSYYLSGVISWGDGCAQRGRPGIYTMILPYVPWVSKTANITL